jgi:hypothetical protein
VISSEATAQVARLLREAGAAHHRAFIASDGVDPEWPLWYAEFLHPRLTSVLDLPLTRSELVYLLVHAARQHETSTPETDWSSYYAELFVREAPALAKKP